MVGLWIAGAGLLCTCICRILTVLQLLNFDFSLVDTASMSFFGTILRTGDALERVLVEPEGEDDEINEVHPLRLAMNPLMVT